MINKHFHARVPRRSSVFRDPRFLWGVVLIAFSVLGCVFLVERAGQGVSVYQLTRDVAAGETLDLSTLQVVEARPGSNAYVRANNLPKNSVAARAIRGKELLPTSAVAQKEDEYYRRIMVSVSSGLPASLNVGSDIELWFTPKNSSGATDESLVSLPSCIAEGVMLIRIEDHPVNIGTRGGTRIEVRVKKSDLPVILRAENNDGILTAVPAGGSNE